MELITFNQLRPLLLGLNNHWSRNLKVLAELIGLGPQKRPYLANVMNPGQMETNKINLYTTLRVLDVSPEEVRYEFIRAMLVRWDLVPVKLPDVAGGNPDLLYQDLAEASSKMGSVAQALLDALEDRVITKAEALSMEQEVGRTVSRLLTLLFDCQNQARG